MTGAAAPAAWAYITIPEAERHRLPALGQEGWELAAVGGGADARLLYLKRPNQGLKERVTAEQRSRYYSTLGLDPHRAPERDGE